MNIRPHTKAVIVAFLGVCVSFAIFFYEKHSLLYDFKVDFDIHSEKIADDLTYHLNEYHSLISMFQDELLLESSATARADHKKLFKTYFTTIEEIDWMAQEDIDQLPKIKNQLEELNQYVNIKTDSKDLKLDLIIPAKDSLSSPLVEPKQNSSYNYISFKCKLNLISGDLAFYSDHNRIHVYSIKVAEDSSLNNKPYHNKTLAKNSLWKRQYINSKLGYLEIVLVTEPAKDLLHRAVVFLFIGLIITLVIFIYLLNYFKLNSKLQNLNEQLNYEILEKTASEKQLQKSELLYRSFFESTPVMLHTINIKGELTNVNTKWLDTLGYKLGEVIGRKSSDFLSVASKKDFKTNFEKFMKSGQIKNIPYQFVKKNGEIIDTLLSANINRAPNNDLIDIQAAIIDVTEKKIVEEVLYFISQDLQADVGQKYYNNITKYLTQSLSVEYAFIGVIKSDCKRIRTISVNKLGTVQPNFEYLLDNTPCDNVVGRNICLYETGITNLFPKDQVLFDMQADSYAGAPLFDSEGKSIGVIGVIGTKPITNSKIIKTVLGLFTISTANEMERENSLSVIEKSERNYRELFNSNNDAILVATKKRIIVDCNKAFEEMFAYKLSEIKGKETSCIYANQNHFKELAKHLKAGNNEGVIKLIEYQRKDGTTFIGETNPFTFGTKEGETTNFVGIIRNVSNKIKLEKEVSKLKVAVEQSANPIVITNINGNIEYVNNHFSKSTGYTASEVIGQNPRILNSGKHPKEFFTHMWTQILKGEIWNGIIQNKRKSGEIYWESNTISPVFDSNNKIINFIDVKEDITEQIKAEKKLLTAILETEAAERKKFAENLHDELGPFLSGIKLYIQEIAHNDIPSDHKKMLISELKEMVDDSIKITKSLSHNLMPGILLDYGLQKAIQSFCDKITQLNKINIHFNTDIKTGIDSTVDLVLYRITIELINNTLKHANAKNINIDINLKHRLVNFIYGDNGKGFDVDKEISEKSGLGLKNIINRINSIKGEYNFFSFENKGMYLMLKVDLDNLFIN